MLAFLLRGELYTTMMEKIIRPVVYCGAFQLCSTMAETLFSFVFLIKLSAWLSAGPFGSRSHSRDCIDAQIEDTSDVGLHGFRRLSKHRLLSAYTFGWNTLDKNLTVGSLFGKKSLLKSTIFKRIFFRSKYNYSMHEVAFKMMRHWQSQVDALAIT